MKEFIEYLVKSIAKNPDDVTVEEVHIENTFFEYQINVNPEDMGLIIGKEGRTIKSIRSLAKAKAIKDQVKVNVKLIEPEGSERPIRAEVTEEVAETPEAVTEAVEEVVDAPEVVTETTEAAEEVKETVEE